MEYKVEKTPLGSSIIASELVILNSPFYRKRILVIASQCAAKLKILDTTKTDIFGRKIPKNYCHCSFSCVEDHLTC